MESRSMWNQVVGIRLLVLPLACAGCATTGTAVGELERPATKGEEAVTMVWKSAASDPDRGTISGTLPDGTHYSGQYFEVIKTAEAALYEPAWEGWARYWPGWEAPWPHHKRSDPDWTGFIEIYTGRVIANMKSDDGQVRVRCRFTISEPREGLKGGGNGSCQMSNGDTIDHVTLSAT